MSCAVDCHIFHVHPCMLSTALYKPLRRVWSERTVGLLCKSLIILPHFDMNPQVPWKPIPAWPHRLAAGQTWDFALHHWCPGPPELSHAELMGSCHCWNGPSHSQFLLGLMDQAPEFEGCKGLTTVQMNDFYLCWLNLFSLCFQSFPSLKGSQSPSCFFKWVNLQCRMFTKHKFKNMTA